MGIHLGSVSLLGRKVGSAGTFCLDHDPDGAGGYEGGEGQREYLLSRTTRNEDRGLGQVSTPLTWATAHSLCETYPLSWHGVSSMDLVPMSLTSHPFQAERDFFGRVVVRKAAALSTGMCVCGGEGGSGRGRGWIRGEDQPYGPHRGHSP